MKAIFAILVELATIFVAFISLAEAIKCPPQNEADVTLLPNPNNCTTYYLCNEGIPWLMICPDGLEFNAELRVCDLPEHAKCRKSIHTSTPPPASSSTRGPPITGTPIEPLADLLKHRSTTPGSRPPHTRPTRPGSRPTPPGTQPPVTESQPTSA